jgi:hypothetical protein
MLLESPKAFPSWPMRVLRHARHRILGMFGRLLGRGVQIPSQNGFDRFLKEYISRNAAARDRLAKK